MIWTMIWTVMTMTTRTSRRMATIPMARIKYDPWWFTVGDNYSTETRGHLFHCFFDKIDMFELYRIDSIRIDYNRIYPSKPLIVTQMYRDPSSW
mmetsp:Transcript_13576/g.34142  ORF Transcript_13576/g.34142 Transcript_13576/m.34142 type:complete len:94 (+) Transcript_13576:594-875(+)